MSKEYTTKLLMREFVTHNVQRFIIERPAGFDFKPGQGVELAINQSDWKNEGRPFTPTNLQDDKVLEFIIKQYPDHEGVTRELHNLPAGSELLVSEPFGTIQYKGPGVFLAGGVGITPFIAILRQQAGTGESDDNTLIFSNKTAADVFCENEFRHYLGERCILTCTGEKAPGYENRRIDKDFLKEKVNDFDQHFYVCGPPGFMKAINQALEELGADPQNLVFEQ
jgi:ferredoxin-NADP reductase